ncbi:hypothetical protein H7E99_16985 [Proteus mirabilis]|uniref:hypothetical protein n=1 Tax=Proteus mirabilis TaxID=584 RepID=UPI00101BB8C3|nr:hypothetical protein [Proteus mirabilis]EKW9421194.1 hypothetical protein [Proteus mirabilis]ELB1101065.1 hypothetical protein [Proteus mirabilis]MBB6663546.1 hypothetical protein [Proteus mirabilis]MBB6706960.1 hypothetical protein [Proteus mirabilis]MBB6729088.1 hypothetical protein [Proteus mirabilis]
MNNVIAIKFDYSKDRKDPEDILNILTGYVKFYKSIGVITLTSINEKDYAHFELIGLKSGSAIAFISCIKEKFNKLLDSTSSRLASDLCSSHEISTREQIEVIAQNMSTSITNNELNGMKIEPVIDVEQLGKSLSDLSALNSKLKNGESTYIGFGSMENDSNYNYTKLNNKFTFVGDVSEVLSARKRHYKRKSKFYVNVSVNKGDTVWKLEEVETKNIFLPRVADENWLQRYQSGLIDPIGPKDLMEAVIEYNEVYYENKNKKPKLKDVKIIEVIDVVRTKGYQSDMFPKRE